MDGSTKNNRLKIISIFDKHEDFIELQHDSILKNVVGDYEYIIFNNASNPKQSEKNIEVCLKRNLTFININNNFLYTRNPSVDAGTALNKAFEHLKNCKVFKIDSDMFFCNTTNIDLEMKSVDLKYVPTYSDNSEFMWSGYFGINLEKVVEPINFLPGVIPNTDTFGFSATLTNKESYNKKIDILYCILDEDENSVKTMINNACNLRIFFQGNIEIDSSIYAQKYDINKFKKNVLQRYDVLKKRNFPRPFLVDFISFDHETDNLIHFKSSNWANYKDDYFSKKKDAIKKLINL